MTTSTPRTRRSAEHSRPGGGAGGASSKTSATPAAVIAVRRLFATETVDYFVLLGTTLFLTVFGLVMVLSSSAVTSFTESDDFFSGFLRQGMFALLGLPLMLIASRMPVRFWKHWANAAMGLGVVLQLLVVTTPLGIDFNGNRNWLALGSLSIQPSEITKVALVIWLAQVLSARTDRLADLRQLMIPVVPIAGLAIALVLAGHDLGTAIIMTSIVLGALFFAGARLIHLAIPVVLGLIALPFVMGSGNSRADRIEVWLNGCSSTVDFAGPCWQTVHGWWALAAGGIFGVGLGNSKAKWSWLPEADNDFIFAIIGEELGLIGALIVLALFIVLAVVFARIIRARADPFARIAVASVMMWIIGQAFVNIAVVLGVLPVLGVPLPLMSAGGTALITSLVAIGIVLSFARHAPAGAAEAEAAAAATSTAAADARSAAKAAAKSRTSNSAPRSATSRSAAPGSTMLRSVTPKPRAVKPAAVRHESPAVPAAPLSRAAQAAEKSRAAAAARWADRDPSGRKNGPAQSAQNRAPRTPRSGR